MEGPKIVVEGTAKKGEVLEGIDFRKMILANAASHYQFFHQDDKPIHLFFFPFPLEQDRKTVQKEIKERCSHLCQDVDQLIALFHEFKMDKGTKAPFEIKHIFASKMGVP